jgi:hypothetical protein
MRLLISTAFTTLVAGSAVAAEAAIGVDIPRLTVVEYHRPYVALWLENSDGSQIVNLAVWYDNKLKDSEGTKWLKDMRQWWRRTGRELTMPVDGLSSPTRAPGTHQIVFDSNAGPLKDLAPGSYQLVIEAAREVGGRELLRVPFEWPPKAPVSLDVKGESEIGAVTVKLTP